MVAGYCPAVRKKKSMSAFFGTGEYDLNDICHLVVPVLLGKKWHRKNLKIDLTEARRKRKMKDSGQRCRKRQ